MKFHDTELSLSQPYLDQLETHYDSGTVRAIAEDWKHANLAHGQDEKLLYVRVGRDYATYPNTVLYVPGFTEGIVAKAPFAAAMAEKGIDFILPGQHRKKILKD